MLQLMWLSEIHINLLENEWRLYWRKKLPNAAEYSAFQSYL